VSQGKPAKGLPSLLLCAADPGLRGALRARIAGRASVTATSPEALRDRNRLLDLGAALVAIAAGDGDEILARLDPISALPAARSLVLAVEDLDDTLLAGCLERLQPRTASCRRAPRSTAPAPSIAAPRRCWASVARCAT